MNVSYCHNLFHWLALQHFCYSASEIQFNCQVWLQDSFLPEFNFTAYLKSQPCQMFTGTCFCDLILVHDSLQSIHFQKNTLTCMDNSVSMCNPSFNTDYIIFLFFMTKTWILMHHISRNWIINKYLFDVVASQTHEPSDLCISTSNMLNEHAVLFDDIQRVNPHCLLNVIGCRYSCLYT